MRDRDSIRSFPTAYCSLNRRSLIKGTLAAIGAVVAAGGALESETEAARRGYSGSTNSNSSNGWGWQAEFLVAPQNPLVVTFIFQTREVALDHLRFRNINGDQTIIVEIQGSLETIRLVPNASHTIPIPTLASWQTVNFRGQIPREGGLIGLWYSVPVI